MNEITGMVRALVGEAQNAVWNGQNAADAALDVVTNRIVHLLADGNDALVKLGRISTELAQLRAMKQRAQAIAAGRTFLAEVDMRAVAREILGEVSS